MNLTAYAADAILDGTAMPATLWIKMHTGNPGGAGTANASADTRRRSFTRAAASGGVAIGEGSIEWLAWTADETLNHATLWDAESGGNPWWVGELVTPQAILTGQRLAIDVNDLTLTMTVWT
jgi:hypothetical protein